MKWLQNDQMEKKKNHYKKRVCILSPANSFLAGTTLERHVLLVSGWSLLLPQRFSSPNIFLLGVTDIDHDNIQINS